MRFSRILMLAAATVLCSTGMKAQSNSSEEEQLGYKPYPYTFIQVQGGVNKIFSPKSKFNPTYSFAVGHMFTSVVGARLHFNGYETKNGFTSLPDASYKFKYITTDADLMLNLTNMFGHRSNYLVNVYLLGGIGLTYAWDNNQFEGLKPVENTTNAWGPSTDRKSLFSHNARAGVLLDFNVAKHWSVGVEADVNSLSDRFNSKFKNSDDWMMTAQVSVTYKFGFKKAQAPVWETVIDTTWYDDVTYKQGEYKDRDIDKRIFFEIRESDVQGTDAQIAAVAEFLKGVKNGEITISSYADKGTGNPKINMEYSQQRAEKTKQALIDKGVDPNIIKSVQWFGDTVQPYPDDNDKNRVSIITGHGVYSEPEKVVTKKFKTTERQVRVK